MSDWKTISSTYVYKNPWLKVREDEVLRPDGKKGVYGVVEARDYVVIIPKLRGEFLMIEQYRYPVGKRSLEFPAGAIEQNEPIETAAVRELQEESGLQAEKLTKLGFLYEGNGHENIGFHVYLAEDCREVPVKREASEQDMQIRVLSREKLETIISEGIVTDGPSAAAYCLFLLRSRHS